MKKILLFAVALTVISSSAYAYIWSSAVPTAVNMTPEGLVLAGEFNNEGVTCATGPKAILLPQSDSDYNRKLSMALMAFASGKKIEVLIYDPIATNCIQVSAHGYVPVAHHMFWKLY